MVRDRLVRAGRYYWLLLADAYQRVLAGEMVNDLEVVFTTKDGREIVLWGTNNCSIEKGQPRNMRGIFRDITERRQAEMAVRESEDRLRQIAENVDEVVWVVILGFHEALYVAKRRGRNRLSVYQPSGS